MKAGRIVVSWLVVTLCLAGGYVVAGFYDYVPNTWAYSGDDMARNEPVVRPQQPELHLLETADLPQLQDGVTFDSDKIGEVILGELNEDLIGDNFGVTIADLHTGEVIWSHRQTRPLTPASTIKLLTGLAVFDTLDTSERLVTRVVQDPDDPNHLVLVGGGDMMLTADSADDLTFGGFEQASLTDLAEEVVENLQSQGIDIAEATIDLSLDTSYWIGRETSPTWDPSDVEQGWAGPVVSIAVHQGLSQNGGWRRHADVTGHAVETMRDELIAAGLKTVEPAADVSGDDLSSYEEIGSVSSATLADIMKFALETSDNTLTEAMSFLVAAELGYPATFEGARQAVHKVAVDLGLDGSQISMGDASGLGDGSTLTTLVLSQVVHLMYSPEHPQLRPLTRMLPVSALSGSLDERYVNTNAGGLVRAKTGSLIGVTSLAGTVLTNDDHGLIFAIVANDTPGPGQWSSRLAVDNAITELVNCDCSIE